jgi:hypothetical protein
MDIDSGSAAGGEAEGEGHARSGAASGAAVPQQSVKLAQRLADSKAAAKVCEQPACLLDILFCYWVWALLGSADFNLGLRVEPRRLKPCLLASELAQDGLLKFLAVAPVNIRSPADKSESALPIWQNEESGHIWNLIS